MFSLFLLTIGRKKEDVVGIRKRFVHDSLLAQEMATALILPARVFQ